MMEYVQMGSLDGYYKGYFCLGFILRAVFRELETRSLAIRQWHKRKRTAGRNTLLPSKKNRCEPGLGETQGFGSYCDAPPFLQVLEMC